MNKRRKRNLIGGLWYFSLWAAFTELWFGSMLFASIATISASTTLLIGLAAVGGLLVYVSLIALTISFCDNIEKGRYKIL
jgi:hypothetical protein